MYQSLKRFIPKDPSVVDDRSIHFLDFPSVREEYFDPEIERAVGRMQAVIELGRTIRERKNVSLKTPLKELVVIHHDKQYHEDIRSLESYIVEELNVREILVTADEQQYGVKYKAQADWKTLGQKLRKDLAKVKKALPSVTSEMVQDYVKNKEMVLDGIKLTEEDLNVIRYFDGENARYETNSDRDVLILLDCQRYPELEQEGVAREVINRVQRLRKASGLLPTDDIYMYYNILADPNNELENALTSQQAVQVKVLKKPVLPSKDKPDTVEVFCSEDITVSWKKSKFNMEERLNPHYYFVYRSTSPRSL